MKKIPGIYKPNIDKFINNNEKTFYSYEKKKESISFDNPIDVINRLMSSGSYIFNKKLFIVTNSGNYHTRIAGRIGKKIVTLDGDTIDINSIISINEE